MIQISTDYHYIISNNILRQLRLCDNIFFYQAWISDIYKFKNYRPGILWKTMHAIDELDNFQNNMIVLIFFLFVLLAESEY